MPTDFREVVVVGAGVAGMRAAQTLRQAGYDGALTIVGDERQPRITARRFRRSCSADTSDGPVSTWHPNSTSRPAFCAVRKHSGSTRRRAPSMSTTAARHCRCTTTVSSSRPAPPRAPGRAVRCPTVC